jgi:hypothetical protein
MEKASKFDEWMIKKIQSVHYSNHESMSRAFENIINNEEI